MPGEREPTQPEMRETNVRLNRRVQTAEKALGEWQKFAAIASEQRTGRFLPACLAWAVGKAEQENAALRARVARLEGAVEDAEKRCRSVGQVRIAADLRAALAPDAAPRGGKGGA